MLWKLAVRKKMLNALTISSGDSDGYICFFPLSTDLGYLGLTTWSKEYFET